MSTDNFQRPEPRIKDADSHRALIRSTSIISLGTLSSRILGFIRDIILAKLLGTGFRADAFFVAQKIPNLFRDLVGEGATNAAIVPVLSEYRQKEEKESFWNFVSIVLSLAFIVLSIITIVGIIFAEGIVRIIAPGFMDSPEKVILTVSLTKLMFPYLILIGLTSYSMAILYTFRSFAVPAFTPCLLNIAVIISAYISTRTMSEPVFGLALGVLAGGFLQLIFQWPATKKIGFTWKMPKSLSHPGAKKIGKLLVPRMIGSGVYQLTILIDTFCASMASIVGPGGISAIYYANRIIQFPMGIFSVAMASVLLPTLSGMASKNDTSGIRRTLIFFLENIIFIMCPIIVILLFLSEPIIRILFQRGEFSTYSTSITTSALVFSSLGLLSFGGIKILVTAFHSLQDTKTPVKVAGICLLINTGLNFVLMVPLKIGGIALASSLAGTVDFLLLFYIMNKRLGGMTEGLLKYILSIGIACVLMAGVVYFSWISIIMSIEEIKLVIVGLIGVLSYGIICFVLNINQARKIWSYVHGGFKQ
ncbi:MAG: murein biosynthesis integral membrane protein MurJ [Candidatus Omnitrophica bacterium]|nr:murein biosynthesis integral membrane protein MurJ [Candidatus Omnitrophota bacterium]